MTTLPNVKEALLECSDQDQAYQNKPTDFDNDSTVPSLDEDEDSNSPIYHCFFNNIGYDAICYMKSLTSAQLSDLYNIYSV